MATPTLSSAHPSLVTLLGRYVYKDEKSDKYWTLDFRPETGTYVAHWGRTGAKPQGPAQYSGTEALQKVREKMAKGYRLVAPTGVGMKGYRPTEAGMTNWRDVPIAEDKQDDANTRFMRLLKAL